MKAVTIQNILKSNEYFKTYIYACMYMNTLTKYMWINEKISFGLYNIHVYNKMTITFSVS